MQRSSPNNITRILLGVLIGGAVMIGAVYAINTQMDGWASTVAIQNITIYDGSCRKLSGVAGYFVPTRTATEWNAFNAVAASKGLTVASCAAPINCSYTTTGWGACSASCGGGVQAYYYTITAAAQNGGTCPVSEGQVVCTQACNTQACVVHNYTWRTAYFETCHQALSGYSRRAFYCQDDINYNNTGPQVANSICVAQLGQPGYNQWFVECIGNYEQPNNGSFFFDWMPIINL